MGFASHVCEAEDAYDFLAMLIRAGSCVREELARPRTSVCLKMQVDM